MADAKKNRKRLNLRQKLDALEMLNTGIPSLAVKAKYSVSARFVKLKKEGAELLRKADTQKLSLSTKYIWQSLHPVIEDKVHQFFQIARSLRILLTQNLMRERALVVKEKTLESPSLSSAACHRLTSFSASVGWCQQFLKRHSMNSMLLSSEGGSATVEVAAEGMA